MQLHEARVARRSVSDEAPAKSPNWLHPKSRPISVQGPTGARLRSRQNTSRATTCLKKIQNREEIISFM